MPKKPEIPEHWAEDTKNPEWMEEPAEPVDETPVVYEDKERDLLNDQGTDRMDMMLETSNTKGNELDQELDRLKQKKYQRELEKEKKQKIKDKKSEIRHLKYEPVYDAGEKLKEYGSKLESFVASKKATPEKKAERREKAKKKMNKLASVAKKKAVAFGKSMHEQKSGGGLMAGGQNVFQNTGSRSTGNMIGNNKFMNSNLFDNKGTGFGRDMNLMGNQRKAGGSGVPRIMQGNLLGNNKSQAGKGKKKQKGKPGLKLMNERIRL